MNTWISRARARMKELKITHVEMARYLDVSRTSITHSLNGRREPSLTQLIQWAKILKTTPEWLQFGIDASATTDMRGKGIELAPPLSSYLPVIAWTDPKNWKKEQKKYYAESDVEWIPYAGKTIPDAFSLRVRDDSMESPYGTSFAINSYIIIDPNRTPQHGDFVIVQAQHDSEATLRQFILEYNKKLLKPLNPRYQLTTVKKEMFICGVICQALQNF